MTTLAPTIGTRPVIDCYVRNSTALQVDNWRAEFQKTELPRLVIEQNYEPKVWEEQGQSGETLEARPKMQAILARVAEKASAGIATVDFGRLSRDVDMIDGLKIWETCKRARAIIITPGKVWHPGTSQDDDFAFITFWYESRNKRDLVTKLFQGLTKRAEHGPLYRGHPPFGYDKVIREYPMPSGKVRRNAVWVINPAERDVCLEIGRMYLSAGHREIRAYLTAKAKDDPAYRWHLKQRRMKHPVADPGWNEQAVRRILTHPVYRGFLPVFRKRRTALSREAPIRTHHVPDLQIFPDELARAIDAVAQTRRFGGAGGRVEPNSPYLRLLKCPRCGDWMSLDGVPAYHDGEKQHPSHYYYDCSRKLRYGKDRCPGCRIAVGAIHAALVPLVREQIDCLTEAELEERAQALLSGTDDRLKELRAEEEALKKGIAEYNRDYYVAKKLPIPEAIFLETIGAWSAQLADIQRRIHELEGRRKTDISPDVLATIEELKADLGNVLAGQPPTVQNAILRALFREIVLEREDYTVPRGNGYRYPARVVRYETVYDYALDGRISRRTRASTT